MMIRNRQTVKSVLFVILSLSLEQPKRPHPRRLDYDAFPSFPAWRFAVPITQIADLSGNKHS
jgi:hypothetical protein